MASEACCKLSSVSHQYTPTGQYETIAGFHTYIVGPKNATKGIIDIHDIFGMAPQTIQGADRLSAQTGALVLVPDFFHAAELDKNIFPVDTPEKKEQVQAFMSGPAEIQKGVQSLIEIRAAVEDKYPLAAGHWGVFGLCWGGKVAVVACGAGNEGSKRRFNVSGTAHPGLLAVEDAEAQTAPHLLLASPGEPADIVAKYKEILSQPGKQGEVETYETMFHGWMGAKADLQNDENVKEYERGYSHVAGFFVKYL